jgi:RNA polymerase sigma factor (sigma-70 family)
MAPTALGDPRDRVFERLYETYLREVYRYVLAMVRNPAEAEDVTQTTFLNAYRALRAGAEPHAPHNWLIAIAHNTCRSSVRRAMRRPQEVPLGEAADTAADLEQPNVRELLRALRRLPSNQRSALAMRELEGRTYPEIAETLGVTVPAVEALIARARRTLRTQAATLRGLAALLLPRSLRGLRGSGEAAAGGALGGGALAKVVAVALVGVAGFASAGAGARHELKLDAAPVHLTMAEPGVAAPLHLAGLRPARSARAPAPPPGLSSARPARTPGPAGRTPVTPVAPASPAAVSAPATAEAPAADSSPASTSATAPVQEVAGPVQQATDTVQEAGETVQQTADTAVATVQQAADTAAATVTASVPAVPPVEAPALPVAPPPLLP